MIHTCQRFWNRSTKPLVHLRLSTSTYVKVLFVPLRLLLWVFGDGPLSETVKARRSLESRPVAGWRRWKESERSLRFTSENCQREFILKLSTEYLTAFDRDEAKKLTSQDYRASRRKFDGPFPVSSCQNQDSLSGYRTTWLSCTAPFGWTGTRTLTQTWSDWMSTYVGVILFIWSGPKIILAVVPWQGFLCWLTNISITFNHKFGRWCSLSGGWALSVLLFWFSNSQFDALPLLSIKPAVNWKSWHPDNNIKSDIFHLRCLLSLSLLVHLSLSCSPRPPFLLPLNFSLFVPPCFVLSLGEAERERGGMSAVDRQNTSVEVVLSRGRTYALCVSDLNVPSFERAVRQWVWERVANEASCLRFVDEEGMKKNRKCS